MNKRGQAALEFLMTYGWAILVVLIAIGALAYLVDFQSLVGDRCQLSPPLYCESYKADTTTVTMQIKNALTNQIQVTYINLSQGDPDGCGLAFTTDIASGGSAQFAVTGCTGLSSGSKIKSPVTVTYSETGGLSGIVKTGQLVVGIA